MDYPKLAPIRQREGVAESTDGRSTIRSVLLSLGGTASAVDILNSSHYRVDIDDFYLQLRNEILMGDVVEIDDGRLVRLLRADG